MRQVFRSLALVSAVAGLLVIPGAHANELGTYDVLITGAAVSEGIIRIVVTGSPSGAVEIGSDCAQAGTYPKQPVVVETAEDRQTAEAVIITPHELRAGTVLRPRQNLGSCTDAGVSYMKFQAVVE